MFLFFTIIIVVVEYLQVNTIARQIDVNDNMSYVTVDEYVCVPQKWLLHWSLSTMNK